MILLIMFCCWFSDLAADILVTTAGLSRGGRYKGLGTVLVIPAVCYLLGPSGCA